MLSMAKPRTGTSACYNSPTLITIFAMCFSLCFSASFSMVHTIDSANVHSCIFLILGHLFHKSLSHARPRLLLGRHDLQRPMGISGTIKIKRGQFVIRHIHEILKHRKPSFYETQRFHGFSVKKYNLSSISISNPCDLTFNRYKRR
jgi:hypothetical protein